MPHNYAIRMLKKALLDAGSEERHTRTILKAIEPFAIRVSKRSFQLADKVNVDSKALADAFRDVTGLNVSTAEKMAVSKAARPATRRTLKETDIVSPLAETRATVIKTLPLYEVERIEAVFMDLIGNELTRIIVRSVEREGGPTDIAKRCAELCSGSIKLGLLSAYAGDKKHIAACKNLLALEHETLPYAVRQGQNTVLYAFTA